MDLKSLENLEKNSLNEFNLYTDVIINSKKLSVYYFICEEKHEGRLHSVCYELYKSTENLDILKELNGIVNPFIISKGDIIYYLDKKDINNARSNASIVSGIVSAIKASNKDKEHKIDSNRIADKNNEKNTEKNKSFIPPNILQTNDNASYNDGIITISPNF